MTDIPSLENLPSANTGINQITVAGYKSIYDEQSIEIRPLTILAGANSSGKSSIIQPLLLLKQTLEATYDPGPLLLNGPNIHFTTASQMFSRLGKKHADNLDVTIFVEDADKISIRFVMDTKGLKIETMTFNFGSISLRLREDMSHKELAEMITIISNGPSERLTPTVLRNRCFLEVLLYPDSVGVPHVGVDPRFVNYIHSTIHVPGFRNRLPDARGNSGRDYPIAAIGSTFSGTFDYYVASVIEQWQSEGSSKLRDLEQGLETLALTSKVEARRINDTQIELWVARTIGRKKSITKDLVNISDVGIGVSQTFPTVVALHVASPGQLVYLEEPELHLHPRAQQAMAQILADAAMRGVHVVAETHSALLLLAVQTLVAEGKLPPDLVKLHWFTRGEDGKTHISSADLDENGAFGEWPEDFGMVELDAQSRYLDAVEGRHFRQPINE